jgi:hypothetical protein
VGYDAQKHGKTDGKKLSRKIVNDTVIEMVERFKPSAFGLDGLSIIGTSLPSTVGKQEKDLSEALAERGCLSYHVLAEADFNVYWKNKRLKTFDSLSHRYMNTDFEKAFGFSHRFFSPAIEGKSCKPNWFWFDACGNAFNYLEYDNSNIQKFFNCLVELSPNGVGFFTARLSPRNPPRKGVKPPNTHDVYELMTGKRPERITHEAMIQAYVDYLVERLPSHIKPFCKIVYPTHGTAFFVIGFAKDWKPATVDINLSSHLPYIGADPVTIYRHKKNPDTRSQTKKQTKKQTKTVTKEKTNMDTKLINAIIVLTAQGKSSDQVTRQLCENPKYDELLYSIGSVAGYKAAIMRGAYGDTIKAKYCKAVATAMHARGQRDKTIRNKTGLTVMQLAGIKAAHTRKLNKAQA